MVHIPTIESFVFGGLIPSLLGGWNVASAPVAVGLFYLILYLLTLGIQVLAHAEVLDPALVALSILVFVFIIKCFVILLHVRITNRDLSDHKLQDDVVGKEKGPEPFTEEDVLAMMAVLPPKQQVRTRQLLKMPDADPNVVMFLALTDPEVDIEVPPQILAFLRSFLEEPDISVGGCRDGVLNRAALDLYVDQPRWYDPILCASLMSVVFYYSVKIAPVFSIPDQAVLAFAINTAFFSVVKAPNPDANAFVSPDLSNAYTRPYLLIIILLVIEYCPYSTVVSACTFLLIFMPFLVAFNQVPQLGEFVAWFFEQLNSLGLGGGGFSSDLALAFDVFRGAVSVMATTLLMTKTDVDIKLVFALLVFFALFFAFVPPDPRFINLKTLLWGFLISVLVAAVVYLFPDISYLDFSCAMIVAYLSGFYTLLYCVYPLGGESGSRLSRVYRFCFEDNCKYVKLGVSCLLFPLWLRSLFSNSIMLSIFPSDWSSFWPNLICCMIGLGALRTAFRIPLRLVFIIVMTFLLSHDLQLFLIGNDGLARLAISLIIFWRGGDLIRWLRFGLGHEVGNLFLLAIAHVPLFLGLLVFASLTGGPMSAVPDTPLCLMTHPLGRRRFFRKSTALIDSHSEQDARIFESDIAVLEKQTQSMLQKGSFRVRPGDFIVVSKDRLLLVAQIFDHNVFHTSFQWRSAELVGTICQNVEIEAISDATGSFSTGSFTSSLIVQTFLRSWSIVARDSIDGVSVFRSKLISLMNQVSSLHENPFKLIAHACVHFIATRPQIATSELPLIHTMFSSNAFKRQYFDNNDVMFALDQSTWSRTMVSFAEDMAVDEDDLDHVLVSSRRLFLDLSLVYFQIWRESDIDSLVHYAEMPLTRLFLDQLCDLSLANGTLLVQLSRVIIAAYLNLQVLPSASDRQLLDLTSDYYCGIEDDEFYSALDSGKKCITIREGIFEEARRYAILMLSKTTVDASFLHIPCETARGHWSANRLDLIYFKNEVAERSTIQSCGKSLRNLFTSLADAPHGYPAIIRDAQVDHIIK